MFHNPVVTPAVRVHRRQKSRVFLQKHYKLDEVAAFIRDGPFFRVALQFPDDLLGDAIAVIDTLKSILDKDTAVYGVEVVSTPNETAATNNNQKNTCDKKIRLFVIADNTFGSCCPDEITAQHYGGECIIHFGNACMSRSTRIPVFYVHNNFRFFAFASFFPAEEESLSSNLVLRAVFLLQDRLKNLRNSLEKKHISANITLVVVGTYSSRSFLETACHQWPREHKTPAAEGDVAVEWCSYTSVEKATVNVSEILPTFNESSSWVISGVRFSRTKPTTLQYFLFVGSSDSLLPLHLLNVHEYNFFHYSEVLREEAFDSNQPAVLTILDELFSFDAEMEKVTVQKSSDNNNNNSDSNIDNDNGNNSNTNTTTTNNNNNNSDSNCVMKLDAALEKHFCSSNTANKLMNFQTLLKKRMRQRAFNIEFIRSSTSIGIVVASLAIKGYYETTMLLYQLLRIHGKQSYIIYIGHLNKHKIANFVDSVDCFVTIACPNSRESYFPCKDDDFLKPIVTPIEVILALQTEDDDFGLFGHPAAYSTTFDSVLPLLREAMQAMKADGTGNKTTISTIAASAEKNSGSTALVRTCPGVVASQYGDGALARLHQRAFIGLDPRNGQTPVQEKVVEGRHGIARGYTSEKHTE